MDPNTRYCSLCNNPISPDDAFCTACGASALAAPPAPTAPEPPPVFAAPPATPAAAGVIPPPLTDKLPPQEPPKPMAPPTPPMQSAYSAMQAPVTAPAPVQASAETRAVPPVGTPPTQNPYGSMAPANTPPQPQPYQPQQAQNAQPAGYGAPPMAPAGYGTNPPVPPTGGSYGSGGYPPYGGAPGATPPPPKKRNTALIAILCVVGVVVIGGAIALFMLYGPPATARREAAIQLEYQQLLESICSSDTPKAVAKQRSALDTFNSDNPGIVDSDLEKLMVACEDYEYGDRNDEETFLSMISNLERLENSSITLIADCATELLPGVNDDYDVYLASIEVPEEIDPDEPNGPPASDPFAEPVPYELTDDLIVIEGDNYYFEFENTSGKTIDYLECWIFCYDENGNPIDGIAIEASYNNIEWEVDFPTIAPGGMYTAEEFGYFEFYRCEGTAFALPFVNYIEFTDGSYWGITDYVADMEDVFYQMGLMKETADAYAQTVVDA